MIRQANGVIINLGSIASLTGLPTTAADGLTKAALISLSRTWAAGYGSQGVRVNTVTPGPTRTSTWPTSSTTSRPGQEALAVRPAGRTGGGRQRRHLPGLTPRETAASPPGPYGPCTAQPQHPGCDHCTRKRLRMPTTAPEKLTPKGRATRGRIVAAAAELMSRRGVAGTTIEDIQEAAAVSTSQMYHYFADKGDLVAAVIDFQTDQVLAVQHLGLDRLECLDDLHRWRDIMVDMMRGLGCVGGCPVGSLANELSETDPLARAQLTRSFAQWETMIHDGLTVIATRGELPDRTDIDQVALAMLAAIQGGLLLSQVRRSTAPLEAAVDTMIDHLRTLGVR